MNLSRWLDEGESGLQVVILKVVRGDEELMDFLFPAYMYQLFRMCLMSAHSRSQVHAHAFHQGF